MWFYVVRILIVSIAIAMLPSQPGAASGAALQPQEKCGAGTSHYDAKQLLDRTLNRPAGSPFVAVLLVATPSGLVRSEGLRGDTDANRSPEQRALAGSL